MGALVLDIAKVNSHVLPNLDKTTDKLKEAAQICSQLLRNLPSSFGYKDRIDQIGDRITRYGISINDVTIKISEKTEKAATIKAKNDSKARSIVSVAAAAGIGAAAGAIIGPKTSIAVAAGAAVGAAVGAKSAKKDKNGFQKIADGFKKAGAKIAKHTTSFVKKVGDGTKKLFKAIGNGIKNTGKKIAEKTTSFVKKVGQGAKDLFKKAGKAIKNTCSKIAGGVTSLCKKIGDGIKNFGKKIGEACKKIAGKVKSFFSDKVVPWFKDLTFKKVFDFFTKTIPATFSSLVVSLVEGIASLAEALVDAVVLIGGGILGSLGGAIVDVVEGFATGDWKFDKTSAVWKKGLLPFIGKDWTSKAFDYAAPIFTRLLTPLGIFYDPNEYVANWAKRGNVGYKVGKGVGYVAGIVILSVITAGAAGAASGAASAAGTAVGATGTVYGSAGVATAFSSISAFTSTAASTAATGISTALAATAKFGQKVGENYNTRIDKDVEAHYIEQLKLSYPTLTDEELKALYEKGLEAGAFKDYDQVRKSAMDNISGAKIAGVIGTSAAQGAIEGTTWYYTYGTGSEVFKAGAKNLATGVGKKVGKEISAKTFEVGGKALLQAGKEYANEFASIATDGEMDWKKANINALASASASIIYDKLIGGNLKKLTKESRTKATQDAAQEAIKKTAAESAMSSGTATPANVLDYVDDGKNVETIQKGLIENSRPGLSRALDKIDPFLRLATGDGSKKAFGKTVKDTMKEVEKGIIIPMASDFVETIVA